MTHGQLAIRISDRGIPEYEFVWNGFLFVIFTNLRIVIIFVKIKCPCYSEKSTAVFFRTTFYQRIVENCQRAVEGLWMNSSLSAKNFVHLCYVGSQHKSYNSKVAK